MFPICMEPSRRVSCRDSRASQIRARPDLSQQLLRESARNQYQLEAPGPRRAEGQVPSDRQIVVKWPCSAGEGRREVPRTFTPARPLPHLDPVGENPGPVHKCHVSAKALQGFRNPHILPGASREQTGSKAKTDWSRPSRETGRLAPRGGSDPGSSAQKGHQGGQEGNAVSPRRAPPSVPSQIPGMLPAVFLTGSSAGAAAPLNFPRQGSAQRIEAQAGNGEISP